MGLFTRTKVEAPPRVPTDEIVPFHSLDGNRVMRAMILEFSYRFDAALDFDKLRAALERLLEIGDWRKLGARVRLNKSGQAEYHLPERFTKERPAVLFTHATHTMDIAQHPVASKMPHSVSKPTIFGDPDAFLSVVHGSKRIEKFEDWTSTDRPPLTVHVANFQDATLITITFSHTLFDAMGIQILLKAWLCVLDGREQDVPPFIGFTTDPMNSLIGRVSPKRHILYKYVSGRMGLVLLIISILLDYLRYPKQETRTICIPSKFVHLLRARATSDLQATHDKTAGAAIPFLSDGDILFAWWARVTCAAQRLRASRPVRLGNFFTFRGILDDVLPPGAAYVGNAISIAYTFTTVAQLLSRSLGSVALELRQALSEQREREQVEATISLFHQILCAGRLLLFAPHNAVRITWSNWHKARFFDMDFSAAVQSPANEVESHAKRVIVPSYINYTGRMAAVRNSGPLLGRDGQGNWWLQWTLRTDAWPAVQASLDQLANGIV